MTQNRRIQIHCFIVVQRKDNSQIERKKSGFNFSDKKNLNHNLIEVSKKGDDLLSHLLAVPSAQMSLTSLFGMGRGEPHCNNHPKRFQLTDG